MALVNDIPPVEVKNVFSEVDTSNLLILKSYIASILVLNAAVLGGKLVVVTLSAPASVSMTSTISSLILVQTPVEILAVDKAALANLASVKKG